MKNPGWKEPNQRTVKLTFFFLSERANSRNMPNCPPAKARLEWGENLLFAPLLTRKKLSSSSKSAGIVTAKLLLRLSTSWQEGFFFLITIFFIPKTKVLPLCGPLGDNQEAVNFPRRPESGLSELGHDHECDSHV